MNPFNLIALPVPAVSFLLFVAWSVPFAAAADEVAPAPEEHENRSRFSYGENGLQYDSSNGDTSLWFGVRLQARYTSVDADAAPRVDEYDLNRGRLKLGGHVLNPRFTIYSEYDFTKSTLLDYRATYQFSDAFRLRAGQWKSEYNRERIDSSGNQQFVERSDATYWFTIDRQEGLVGSGRIGAGKRYDSSYWFGILSGTGRGGSLSDAAGLWLGRYQWNFTGTVLPFSQSDLQRGKPAGSVALAFVSGRSNYTRFSGEGGGQLPGYGAGVDNQYEIQQVLLETAWQGRGFSWQQELHWKNIRDRQSGSTQKLVGGYAQAGYFFHERWSFVPAPLELAIRYTGIDSDGVVAPDFLSEVTLAANWFFDGHRNKLSADVSAISQQLEPGLGDATRLRLQWDVSF